MLMWLICRVVDSSSLLSTPACLMLNELVWTAFLFSIIYFRISMDSSAWLHLLESSLNCSCSEEILWRNKLRSASYFSLVSWLWLSILASRIFWWAQICSSSAWRSAQWKQSSLLAIVADGRWCLERWIYVGVEKNALLGSTLREQEKQWSKIGKSKTRGAVQKRMKEETTKARRKTQNEEVGDRKRGKQDARMHGRRGV